MATFRTDPKILVTVAGYGHALDRLIEFLVGLTGKGPMFCGNAIVLDVDVAEKAVEWLKAHGVEQSP